MRIKDTVMSHLISYFAATTHPIMRMSTTGIAMIVRGYSAPLVFVSTRISNCGKKWVSSVENLAGRSQLTCIEVPTNVNRSKMSNTLSTW